MPLTGIQGHHKVCTPLKWVGVPLMKFFKCVVTKPVKKCVIKELKKCADVKVVKCPPKYHDCYKPVKCYDGGIPS